MEQTSYRNSGDFFERSSGSLQKRMALQTPYERPTVNYESNSLLKKVKVPKLVDKLMGMIGLRGNPENDQERERDVSVDFDPYTRREEALDINPPSVEFSDDASLKNMLPRSYSRRVSSDGRVRKNRRAASGALWSGRGSPNVLRSFSAENNQESIKHTNQSPQTHNYRLHSPKQFQESSSIHQQEGHPLNTILDFIVTHGSGFKTAFNGDSRARLRLYSTKLARKVRECGKIIRPIPRKGINGPFSVPSSSQRGFRSHRRTPSGNHPQIKGSLAERTLSRVTKRRKLDRTMFSNQEYDLLSSQGLRFSEKPTSEVLDEMDEEDYRRSMPVRHTSMNKLLLKPKVKPPVHRFSLKDIQPRSSQQRTHETNHVADDDHIDQHTEQEEEEEDEENGTIKRRNHQNSKHLRNHKPTDRTKTTTTTTTSTNTHPEGSQKRQQWQTKRSTNTITTTKPSSSSSLARKQQEKKQRSLLVSNQPQKAKKSTTQPQFVKYPLDTQDSISDSSRFLEDEGFVSSDYSNCNSPFVGTSQDGANSTISQMQLDESIQKKAQSMFEKNVNYPSMIGELGQKTAGVGKIGLFGGVTVTAGAKVLVGGNKLQSTTTTTVTESLKPVMNSGSPNKSDKQTSSNEKEMVTQGSSKKESQEESIKKKLFSTQTQGDDDANGQGEAVSLKSHVTGSQNVKESSSASSLSQKLGIEGVKDGADMSLVIGSEKKEDETKELKSGSGSLFGDKGLFGAKKDDKSTAALKTVGSGEQKSTGALLGGKTLFPSTVGGNDGLKGKEEETKKSEGGLFSGSVKTTTGAGTSLFGGKSLFGSQEQEKKKAETEIKEKNTESKATISTAIKSEANLTIKNPLYAPSNPFYSGKDQNPGQPKVESKAAGIFGLAGSTNGGKASGATETGATIISQAAPSKKGGMFGINNPTPAIASTSTTATASSRAAGIFGTNTSSGSTPATGGGLFRGTSGSSNGIGAGLFSSSTPSNTISKTPSSEGGIFSSTPGSGGLFGGSSNQTDKNKTASGVQPKSLFNSGLFSGSGSSTQNGTPGASALFGSASTNTGANGMGFGSTSSPNSNINSMGVGDSDMQDSPKVNPGGGLFGSNSGVNMFTGMGNTGGPSGGSMSMPGGGLAPTFGKPSDNPQNTSFGKNPFRPTDNVNPYLPMSNASSASGNGGTMASGLFGGAGGPASGSNITASSNPWLISNSGSSGTAQPLFGGMGAASGSLSLMNGGGNSTGGNNNNTNNTGASLLFGHGASGNNNMAGGLFGMGGSGMNTGVGLMNSGNNGGANMGMNNGGMMANSGGNEEMTSIIGKKRKPRR
mmetsp:Transcript_19226/g.21777  ORF Transcript_19226/g.21777 Transcript_19226/m.21777 type:complete len:1316 (-) Transcript_19226:204-4151(-)